MRGGALGFGLCAAGSGERGGEQISSRNGASLTLVMCQRAGLRDDCNERISIAYLLTCSLHNLRLPSFASLHFCASFPPVIFVQAVSGDLQHQIGYTADDVVSTDILGDTHAGAFHSWASPVPFDVI